MTLVSPGGENAELFRNRERYFSINVQAVSNPNMCFTNIVCRWPGSTHDSRIFDNSALCAKFERNDVEGILLVDGGYPCRRYLMTSVANPTTTQEITLVKRTSKLEGRWKECLVSGSKGFAAFAFHYACV